jgi:hypothetical protein
MFVLISYAFMRKKKNRTQIINYEGFNYWICIMMNMIKETHIQSEFNRPPLYNVGYI